jgi:hypothetical protein
MRTSAHIAGAGSEASSANALMKLDRDFTVKKAIGVIEQIQASRPVSHLGFRIDSRCRD